MEEKTIISGNLPLITGKMNVSWKWENESNGLIEWTFTNNDTSPHSVVLYRSGYYFAGAFWPVYVNNGMTAWLDSLSPLPDQGVKNNSPPIAPVEYSDGHHQIMFIFTIAAGKSWSMLEGGFINNQGPTGITLYEVTPMESSPVQLCIGYDPKQASDWDSQTHSSMKPYEPNPSTFDTIMFKLHNAAPDVRLFPGDSVKQGKC